MSLTGAPEEGTLVGSGAEVELSAKMQFWEDDGFEPPQGKIAVDDNRFIGRSKSYWKLDEDPTKGGGRSVCFLVQESGRWSLTAAYLLSPPRAQSPSLHGSTVWFRPLPSCELPLPPSRV